MTMTSMKRTKSDIKLREAMAQPASMDEEPYPYGLQISLNKDCMEKLGIKASDYKVGDMIEIEARAEVRSVSTSKSSFGDSQDMSLQITEMALED